MTDPLKIAVFVDVFPALSETFVLNQITGLIDLGHDISIFASQRPVDPTEHPDVERYRLRERCRYLDMPENRWVRRVKALYQLIRYAPRHLAVPWRSLNAFRYGSDARSLLLFYWAVRLLGNDRFDIIHCHFGPQGQVIALLREFGGIRGELVTTFHGYDMSIVPRRNPDAYRYLFTHGDLFLTVSTVWKERLLELGCNPNRIIVHRMGADLARFEYMSRSHEPGRPPRILTVGRMVEKKGIAYGLQAIAEVIKHHGPVHYSIAGNGPLRPQLEKLVAELNLENYVTFYGWQNQDEVLSLMRASDIILAPSVTAQNGDQEGIPVTLMEAMATGMPVISTWHSGIPELVEDGVSGLLVPERDPDSLKKALLRLLDEPERWEGMGRAGRAKVERDHDVRMLNPQLVRIFQTLAG